MGRNMYDMHAAAAAGAFVRPLCRAQCHYVVSIVAVFVRAFTCTTQERAVAAKFPCHGVSVPSCGEKIGRSGVFQGEITAAL